MNMYVRFQADPVLVKCIKVVSVRLSLCDIARFAFTLFQSEWSLMFNYVYMYPETVRQAVEDFMPAVGILSKIHTHKVLPTLDHTGLIC